MQLKPNFRVLAKTSIYRLLAQILDGVAPLMTDLPLAKSTTMHSPTLHISHTPYVIVKLIDRPQWFRAQFGPNLVYTKCQMFSFKMVFYA